MKISSYNRPDTLLGELCEVVSVVYQKTSEASLLTFFDIFNSLMFIHQGLGPKEDFIEEIINMHPCLFYASLPFTAWKIGHITIIA